MLEGNLFLFGVIPGCATVGIPIAVPITAQETHGIGHDFIRSRSERITQISQNWDIWHSLPASQTRPREFSTGLHDSEAIVSR